MKKARNISQTPPTDLMRCFLSIEAISYEVTTIGNSLLVSLSLPTGICSSLNTSLSAAVPWYRHTLAEGSHFRTSRTQLGRVARGATTRKGPLTPFSRRRAKSAITWMVLPRPLGG